MLSLKKFTELDICGESMSYESDIVEALGLIASTGDAPAAVQSAWTRLQESLAAWRQMHAVANQGLGSGPSVSMFEDKLAQMVAIDLRVYRNALETAGLAADAMQQRRPMGTGWDFSTRHVPA
jgi:hypothetical protein